MPFSTHSPRRRGIHMHAIARVDIHWTTPQIIKHRETMGPGHYFIRSRRVHHVKGVRFHSLLAARFQFAS